MWLIKIRLYKQRTSSSSKFLISYSRVKFGGQRRNFPLSSETREICDFERSQRTKASEVSRTYNVCNNLKLPHEFSVYHSCHSSTLLPYRGCRTSISYVAPTDRYVISLSVGTSIVKSISLVIRRMRVRSGLGLRNCFSFCPQFIQITTIVPLGNYFHLTSRL